MVHKIGNRGKSVELFGLLTVRMKIFLNSTDGIKITKYYGSHMVVIDTFT